MSSDRRVSVVIPAFNSASTISRALDSVLSQSIEPLEIIVVDDGSTDATSDVVARYGPRITVVSQRNSGAAGARNAGVLASRGECIAFLDADDYWYPQKLSLQLDAMDKSSCELCWGKLAFVDGEAAASASVPAAANSHSPTHRVARFEEILVTPYLGTSSVLMTRAAFEKVGGFNTALTSAEDVDLWIRMARDFRCVEVHDVLGVVVRLEHGLSTRESGRTFENHVRVLRDFGESNPELLAQHSGAFRRARAAVYLHWGSHLLTRRDCRQAIGKLLESLRNRPSLRAAYLLANATFRQLGDRLLPF